jgi:hypothetical protein
LLHTRHLLLFVLLLLKRHLLSCAERTAGLTTAVVASALAVPTLSSLLHHLSLHARRQRTIGPHLWRAIRRHHTLPLCHHHLLHHRRIHARHHSRHRSLLRRHVPRHHRLHVAKVLLHLEPVGRHLCLAHAIRVLRRTAGRTTLELLLPTIILALLVIASTAALAKFASTFLIMHIAARFGPLDFDLLAVDGEWLHQRPIHRVFAVKRHETKSPRATGILVHHESSVYDATELQEELLEVLFGALLTHAANENLGRPLLLLAWDGALRIDLRSSRLAFELRRSETVTYNLAIQMMLLDHDDVDSLGIFESQETETS